MKFIFFVFCLLYYSFSYASGDVVSLVTNRGEIKVELFEEKEPELVELFLKRVHAGDYNNLIFHRIIEGFILQGGLYDVDFKNKEKPLRANISYKSLDIGNSYGTFALILRKDNVLTAAPQFFINLADNSYLNSVAGNFRYEVIGKIVSGLDVAEKIAHAKVGQREGLYNVPFYPNEALIKEIK